ncbi:MAG: 7-carboxy-7-deazaguanine synthase QueE [Candidatus Omnitrophica bacterium]|nr:7-carboxy-7-deazaguanine synthase QueE [Candidatus Omnitrophota bacterium]
MAGKISEIFYSVQGEGVYQGEYQVFIRFFECNLDCSFCDTKIGEYQEMSITDVLEEIRTYSNYHSISITGGEPLLQIEFLKELCDCLRSENETIYLETNGTLAEALSEVIDAIDIVAMDFKLPSSAHTGDLWDRHRQFLKVALEKEVFVKAVIGKSTLVEDIQKSINLIKEFDIKIPFILQPQNPFEIEVKSRVNFFKGICRDAGLDVRIVPQMHKQKGFK